MYNYWPHIAIYYNQIRLNIKQHFIITFDNIKQKKFHKLIIHLILILIIMEEEQTQNNFLKVKQIFTYSKTQKKMLLFYLSLMDKGTFIENQLNKQGHPQKIQILFVLLLPINFLHLFQ
ncbi:unnamed protein product [Paramecium pentaurelia]|uniref:Uncharacterized protein n=1 Tax=Paramecium pentaurelia TaxID=43138 RepID=A0A8S1TXW8_9CILI|nr:unnamed protein product [Paramecium pentaurelia]